VTRLVSILTEDWHRFGRALADVPSNLLVDEAYRRGLELLWECSLPTGSEGPLANGRGSKRSAFAREAAEVAVHRFALITQRERLDAATKAELQMYQEGLELDREVVPPMKLEAKALRQQVRELEQRARAAGIDVDALEPQVDWSKTIHVEGYRPTKYETNEDRRAAAVEFFRRVGGR